MFLLWLRSSTAEFFLQVFDFSHLSVSILHFLHLQPCSSVRCDTSPLVVLFPHSFFCSSPTVLTRLHVTHIPWLHSLFKQINVLFMLNKRDVLWQICHRFPEVLNVCTGFWLEQESSTVLCISLERYMHVTTNSFLLVPSSVPCTTRLPWTSSACSPGAAQEAALRGEEWPL